MKRKQTVQEFLLPHWNATGIALVRGMEISTRLDGRGVHLLAYLPDPTYPPLVALLDKVLEGPRADWFHHITAFKDWQGRDRVLVAFGRNPGGGPHYLLDPNDNNRVVRAITIEDVGYRIGHPYPTVDPTGRFLYVSVFAPPWRAQLHNTGGIAKMSQPWPSSTLRQPKPSRRRSRNASACGL